ncbi:MAG: DUF5715 family protein [Actinomycetota bacterium]|nr:DUF5715 family protein [Actinomycetota bacterium]
MNVDGHQRHELSPSLLSPATDPAPADSVTPGVASASDPPGAIAQAVLATYRQAVNALHRELVVDRALAGADVTARVDAVVGDQLTEPPFTTVLERVAGGVDAVRATLVSEVSRFRPGSPSSASDRPSVVRIFLLSQIDTVWWGAQAPFASSADIDSSPELVGLDRLHRLGKLRFRYKLQPRGLPGRVRDRALRTLRPGRQPHTSGLSHDLVRPEGVALLNTVARSFASVAPPGTPPLWLTSALRSVDQQQRLRELGYSAVLPSAHCVGFAFDVAMQWFSRFHADEALAGALLELQDAGVVNVIDEGHAWHLCLSPEHRSVMQAEYERTAGSAGTA